MKVGECISVGEIYVKHDDPHNIGVVLYVSTHHLVRILHSTGKIEIWDYHAFRSIYRSVG
jgi:hypothetical protein